MISPAVAHFVSDSRPRVRRAAVRRLAAEPADSEECIKLLVEAMWDPEEDVWRMALRVLEQHFPWLVLDPSPVREVPEHALATSLGRSWSLLRQAIRQRLSTQRSQFSIEALGRWQQLPGLMPDLLEALEDLGLGGHPSGLAAAEGNVESLSRADGQILMAPTYGCNLDCSYCYARSWNTRYGAMSRENLERALTWCAEHGVNKILLAGGEPTIYRHFVLLVERARELGIGVCLTTNTLYSKRVRQVVGPDRIDLMVSHYDQEFLGDGVGARYLRNLESACASGLEVILRYTLTDRSSPEEWRRLLDLATRLRMGRLNYAFAFRNVEGDNRFVRYPVAQPGGEFERLFVRFVDDCRERGIRPLLCKPLPLCALSANVLRDFLLGGVVRSACPIHHRGFSRNLTINPDLSTQPCSAIGLPGPKITEFDSLEAVGAHYEPLLRNLLDRPYHEACENCVLHYRGLCQAVCLAERAGGSP